MNTIVVFVENIFIDFSKTVIEKIRIFLKSGKWIC